MNVNYKKSITRHLTITGLILAAILAMPLPGHAEQVTHSYDGLNRLIRSDYGNGNVIDYAYDAAGNRTRQQVTTATMTNQPPTANAGPDQTVLLGSLVTLNGSGSHDPDNAPAPLTYSWTQTGGPSVALSGAESVSPGFTPLTAGTYIVDLVVNDGAASSTADSVTITATVSDAASLVVQVPNGGEVWNEGSKHTISWISHNIDSKKRLLLYISKDNGLNWKKIAETKNSGSKIWKIPKKRYVSKQALVKICLKQTAPLCDTSDAAFTINKAQR